jgi:hypothetical protein
MLYMSASRGEQPYVQKPAQTIIYPRTLAAAELHRRQEARCVLVCQILPMVGKPEETANLGFPHWAQDAEQESSRLHGLA